MILQLKCRLAYHSIRFVLPIVPILTQSENWALFYPQLPPQFLPLVFQSSPSPKTGRYCKQSAIAIILCSNPHPVRKLGAIDCKRLRIDFSKRSNPHPVRKLGAMSAGLLHPEQINSPNRIVPILTQSENWALYKQLKNYWRIKHVPILTQSENWALSLGVSKSLAD